MRNSIGKHLCALLLVVLVVSVCKGQSWQREYPNIPGKAVGITELPNEDLVIHNDSLIQCIDQSGNTKWTLNIKDSTSTSSEVDAIATASNGNIFIISSDMNQVGFRIELSPNGSLISEIQLPLPLENATRVHTAPDGAATFLGTGDQGQYVMKLDSVGDSLWTYPLDTSSSYWDIIPTFDGGFALTGAREEPLGSKTPILKLDSSGQFEWEKFNPSFPFPNAGSSSIVQAPDSTFHLKIYWEITNIQTTYFMHLQASASGDSLASYTWWGVEGSRLVKTLDGNLISASLGFGPTTTLDLVKFTYQGSIIWRRSHQIPNRRPNIYRLIALRDSGFAVVGGSTIWGWVETGAFVARMSSDGNLYDNLLKGRTFYDSNGNCVRDINESSGPPLLLSLAGDTSLVFSSGNNGNFVKGLNQGVFQLDVANASNYWGVNTCGAPYQFSFSGSGDTVEVDLPLSPVYPCVDLEVDITSPLFRVCFDGYFSVNYRNVGTLAAANAYVDVEMPPSVTFDSASIPHTLLTSGQYRFDLDSVQPLEQDEFRIHFTVDCPLDPQTLLGTSECATARIYPDSSCIPTSPNWDGSDIEVNINCLSPDSVRFVIRNNSNSAMASPGNYLVLEDNILKTNTSYQLGGNDSIVFYRMPNGSTWTLTTNQSPGHPSSVAPLVSLEGCGVDSSGNFSTGVLPQMPQDDSDGSISIFCDTYVGSYDPNDKAAFPTGLGDFREIEVGKQIDYLIRFQNTGTFSAQDVIIIDSLHENLDLTTLELVGASHPFTWELNPGGEIKVFFNNINLPDSTSDEPNSHGFVKFSIYPDSTLLPGESFTNRAFIYFDFNPAIITNTVFHTIATKMFGVVSIDEAVNDLQFQLEAFPNPFQEAVQFRTQKPLASGAIFSLVNMQGQIVHEQRPGKVKTFTVSPPSLPEGFYFFRLKDDSGRSASGKLILKK